MYGWQQQFMGHICKLYSIISTEQQPATFGKMLLDPDQGMTAIKTNTVSKHVVSE